MTTRGREGVVFAAALAVAFALILVPMFLRGPFPDGDEMPSVVTPRVEFGTVVVVVDGVEVVSSCDGFGHRVYLTPGSKSKDERGVAVTDDPACTEADG